MKALFAYTLCALAAVPAIAQTAHPSTVHKTAAKTTATPVSLKTTQDSLSYAIGLSVANFYKRQNITNINTALVMRAINDVNKNGKLQMDEQQAQSCIYGYMKKNEAEKASGNKKIGEEFLAANKDKPGVVTLPSGLQYQILKEGAGPKPSLTDQGPCPLPWNAHRRQRSSTAASKEDSRSNWPSMASSPTAGPRRYSSCPSAANGNSSFLPIWATATSRPAR